MQTTRIQTCKNCNQLQELISLVDNKIWEISEASWTQKKYNLSHLPDTGLISDLLHYKRILSKRLYNKDYPTSCFSFQDIYKLVIPKVYTKKRSLCCAEPPSSTSTSTTTTTTTTVVTTTTSTTTTSTTTV